MTKNRRYEDHYDALQDRAIATASRRAAPVTLPAPAYGPVPIEWTRERRPVWAWVQWSEGPATRIPAFAKGWNDRVVIVEWDGDGGTRDAVVWRNAVTVRTTPRAPLP